MLRSSWKQIVFLLLLQTVVWIAGRLVLRPSVVIPLHRGLDCGNQDISVYILNGADTIER